MLITQLHKNAMAYVAEHPGVLVPAAVASTGLRDGTFEKLEMFGLIRRVGDTYWPPATGHKHDS